MTIPYAISLLLVGLVGGRAVASKVPTRPYTAPVELKKICDDRASRLVLAAATEDARGNLSQIVAPFAVKEVKLKSGETWNGCPASGMVTYFVSLQSKDGFACDYDITLGVHEASRSCGLERLAFRMCAK